MTLLRVNMIYKALIFSTLFICLISCTNPKGSSSAVKETVTSFDNERVDLYANLNDTVLLSNNIFLVYKHVSIDSFQVKWGKVNNMNYCDTLSVFPGGLPVLAWHNDNAICLTQGCGTDCFFAYILLFKSSEIKKYMYPLAYDTVNNFIACAGDYDSKVFLHVENFLTGEKREIIEDYLPYPHSGHAIESIHFNQNRLFVKWRNSHNKIKEKIFKWVR